MTDPRAYPLVVAGFDNCRVRLHELLLGHLLIGVETL